MVSVDVKQHFNRTQELCESRGGRSGLPSSSVCCDDMTGVGEMDYVFVFLVATSSISGT